MLLSGILSAQVVRSDHERIDFDTTLTGQTDSVLLKLSGTSHTSYYMQSSDPAFFVKDTVISHVPQDTLSVWIYFRPRHNVDHRAALLIRPEKSAGGYNVFRAELTVMLYGTGKYSEPYYNATQNLEEEALKTALKNITAAGQVALGYNGARDKMFMEIDNKKVNGQGAAVNTLECVYTGRLVTGYTSRSDAQTSGNLNTEHTWPQSLFSSNNPMVCDLNHLFVTDETANNKRSNFPFGMVANPTWQDSSKFDGSLFEPRNAHKGRVARAMLYFATRYRDDAVTLSFISSQEATLRKWHQQFPPNTADLKRNDDVFAAQHNRNPYIDHPELLERISNLSGLSTAPARRTLVIMKRMITFEHRFTGSDTILPCYTISMYNSGNQPLQFSSVALDHEDSIFVSYYPSVIPAGQSDSIVISGDARQGSISGFSWMLSRQLLVRSTSNDTLITIPVSAMLDRPIVAGIEEKVPGNAFQLYPNPSNNEFVVSSKDGGSFDISLTTLQGELITAQQHTATAHVSTAQLAAGMYLAHIASGKTVSVQKILVTH